MRLLKRRPTSGQFVEVWESGGEVWSRVVRINDEGHFEVYDDDTDKFEGGVWAELVADQEILGYVVK